MAHVFKIYLEWPRCRFVQFSPNLHILAYIMWMHPSQRLLQLNGSFQTLPKEGGSKQLNFCPACKSGSVFISAYWNIGLSKYPCQIAVAKTEGPYEFVCMGEWVIKWSRACRRGVAGWKWACCKTSRAQIIFIPVCSCFYTSFGCSGAVAPGLPRDES